MKLTEIKLTDSQKKAKALKIENALYKYNIWNATMRPDLLVDVNGSVLFDSKSFTKLPIEFGHVTGDFRIMNCTKLNTLKGCPYRVDGDFDVTDCENLTSLEHGPITAKKAYTINSASLTNLEHAPTTIGTDFFILKNFKLKSLKGCPEHIGNNFSLSECHALSSFDYLPKSIKGTIDLWFCVNLRDVLKIFNIEGVTKVLHTKKNLKNILNKYLPKRDMLNCQDELIEAGLEEYAEVE